MKITVKVDNIYEDGTEVTVTEEADIEEPWGEPDTDDWEDWADEQLFPLTGTGKTEGDAGYFLEITACEDASLVGQKFEWGI